MMSENKDYDCENPCNDCGQVVDENIGGEHPCKSCGMPRDHDKEIGHNKDKG
jgi:hypothetical protein